MDDRFETFNRNSSRLAVEFVNDVEIVGNLKTSQNSSSVLGKLNFESVPRLGGGRIKFTSPITFRDRLIVHHITTNFNTDYLVRKSSDRFIDSDNERATNIFNSGVQKQFTNRLSVEKDVTFLNSNETQLKIRDFNNFKNLTHLFESMILFDKQAIAGELVFDGNFTADELFIGRFIDNSSGSQGAYDINAILAAIRNFRENRIRSLTVSGNARFKSVNINFLNDLDLKNYLSHIVSISDIKKGKEIQIGGNKTFLSDLFTTCSTVKIFNRNIKPDDWIQNAFSKQSTEKSNQQVITGSNWHFNTLSADNIEAKTINDIRITSTENEQTHLIVVDNNPENTITIQSDISFSDFMQIESNFELNTTQMRPCNVYKLFADTISLTQNNWREMKIFGNVKIFSIDSSSSSLSSRGSLTDFFENAVLYDADQTMLMNENAQFKCNPAAEFTFNRITTALNDNSDEPRTLINGVDLVSIFKDAATKNIISLDGRTDTTIIRGLKQFVNTTCDGNETIVTGKMDVKTINEVNILVLNQTMMYRNTDELSIVSGQKLLFIESPTINTLRISSNQTINDLHIDDLFFVHTSRSNRSSPPLVFAAADQLSAPYQIHSNEHLELNVINEISLKYFLENRVKLYDISGLANMNKPQMIDGFITFENLILMGHQTRVERINDVLCDDVILKKSEQNQEISGHKIISGPGFHINRPCHTWKMNDIDFVSAYSQSILLNQKQNLDHLLIKNPYQLDAPSGISISKIFNGINIPDVSDQANQYRVGSTILNTTVNRKNEKIHKLNYIDTTSDYIIKYDHDPLLEIDISSVSLKDVPLSIDSFYVNMINGSEISLCPVQYHIHPPQQNTKEISMQRTKMNQRILIVPFLSNIIIQVRTIFPPEQNYYRHCKFSNLSNTDFKSTIYVNQQKIFTLPNSIVEGLHVFSANGKLYFLLQIYGNGLFIYTQNAKNMWSIVDEIKWPKVSLNWHNVKVLRWKGWNILVAASASQNNTAQMETSSTEIYIFNEDQQHFVRKSSILGDFNIIGAVKIPQIDAYANTTTSKAYDLYLIMAMQGKSHLNIYKAVDKKDGIQFVQTQGFELNEGIESMSVFYEYCKFSDAFNYSHLCLSYFSFHFQIAINYIAAISSSGRFHIYQHLPSSLNHPWISINTDAWHLKLSGYWKNGRALIPLSLKNRLYLLVMADQQQFINNYRINGNRSGTNIAKMLKLIYH